MLNHQGFVLLKGIRLKTSEHFNHLFGHFEWSRLKLHASRPRAEDKGQINMKNGPISFHHDIAVVSILDVEHMLNEAKT